MGQICANPFFRPVIDSQTDGKTVCPFKVPKYSQQCIRFFSCSLFYPHVSVFKIIKIAFIFISLFNIRQLSIKAANEIHYCGTYTDPHYQPLPVQSSRYLLLSRDMSTIRKWVFCVAKNVLVVFVLPLLYSLHPFIDSHLSIHPSIHLYIQPTPALIVGFHELCIFWVFDGFTLFNLKYNFY